MGLDIALVNYKGEVLDSVGDPKNYLHKLLPAASEDSDSLLGWVDWYADTSFNHLQMKRFLAEWDELAERAETPEEQELIAHVRKLAVRCQNDLLLHLKFIGD